MIKEETKFIDSTVFEGMNSIRAIIEAYRSNTNNRRIVKVLYDKDRFSKISKHIGYLKAVSKELNYEVVESDADQINEYTLGNTHGGIIAFATDRKIPVLSECDDIKDQGFYCMIEGIEDPYNFGYSLRSLYSMGCNGIILPERNWMSAAGVVARSSAGASELFKMYSSSQIDCLTYFKSKGYTVVCADKNTDNVLGKCNLKLPILLIVGGEKRGISSQVLSAADLLVKIDYHSEFSASLSAASAATIFAYEISRQNS